VSRAPAPWGIKGGFGAGGADVCGAAEVVVASPLLACGGAAFPPQAASKAQIDKKTTTRKEDPGWFIGRSPICSYLQPLA